MSHSIKGLVDRSKAWFGRGKSHIEIHHSLRVTLGTTLAT